ncbi:GNAT family N-acetyltransferase [Bacillus marasmi]|uniref:GNAT family N-acetyltransferase n=1 Tax=Bacillus marasmi TaxID=1926279 RepID=UPI0011C92D29|nr:GNAT family N-acetyltransferase [Bacillus marasmi]
MGDFGAKKFTAKNGEGFTVRTALPNDAAQVLTLNKAIFAEAPYLLTTQAEFTITPEQEQQFLQQTLDAPGKIALVAATETEIIAFLHFENGHRQRIQHQGTLSMSVKREFRNEGVGTALLKSLLEWAETNPLIEKVCLEVFADNIPAINLYKTLGFTEEGLKKRAIKKSNHDYHDLVLMARFVD